jgi:hypothetical protein
LLYLYPPLFRHEYGQEMTSVFRDALKSIRTATFAARISFRTRELEGLLWGATREHLRNISGDYQWVLFRRFDMRPEFRFPHSTIFLMSVILAGVVLAIEKAKGIQVKYGAGSTSVWPALPWSLGLMLLLACAIVAVLWGILFALRRTGVHRLANLQSGPNSGK